MSVRTIGRGAVKQLRGAPGWRIDAVLAACFVVTAMTTTGRPRTGYVDRDAVAIGLILVATVPYFFRRLAPLPVFIVSITAVATLFVRGNAAGALPMVIAVGAYTVGAYRPWREIVLAAALVNTALVVVLVAGNPGFHIPEFVTSVAVFSATLLAGWTTQSRRLRIDALEREQAEAARRAAADERLRIAQELHDVVAHSLGVIAVQAGVGMHVIDADPAEARRALEHISNASRSSLAEIRRLLGSVRTGEPSIAHAPMPGLADLHRLVSEITDAGLPVRLALAPDTPALPPAVELAAFRIVQEALTNSLRHAGAQHATVQLEASGESLRIRVCDDGPGPKGDQLSEGHGLIGMRERVAMFGGSLEAGPAPEGGFRVHATIPCDFEPAT